MKKMIGTVLVIFTLTAFAAAGLQLKNLQPFSNANGVGATFVTGAAPGNDIDTSNTFFRNFGTNQRTCFTCHEPSTGWTFSPATAKAAFLASNGLDPLFRTNDGSNAPELDVSTLEKKRLAYSLLLTRGVIRIGLPVPANAEFALVAVDDPYHHANAQDLSLFRRPLPAQNLKFASDVMWDGRESIVGAPLDTELGNQADDATKTHANTLSDLQIEDEQGMVQFEETLFFAQTSTIFAGDLTALGASGGPEALANLDFYVGMNDPLGRDPKGKAFNPEVFTLFENWNKSPNATVAQKAVARGEAIFNNKPIHLSGVVGLNDLAARPTLVGTCTTCHNTPNVGSNSASMRLNIGISDEAQRTSDLPLYTFKNLNTGAIIKTSDPGRGLISGKWIDIGAFKVPSLRGLSARAPYFHNGSAATLADVIKYHDQRFAIGLSNSEQADLIAFLNAL